MNKNSFLYGLGTGMIVTAIIFYLTFTISPATSVTNSSQSSAIRNNVSYNNENAENNVGNNSTNSNVNDLSNSEIYNFKYVGNVSKYVYNNYKENVIKN